MHRTHIREYGRRCLKVHLPGRSDQIDLLARAMIEKGLQHEAGRLGARKYERDLRALNATAQELAQAVRDITPKVGFRLRIYDLRSSLLPT